MKLSDNKETCQKCKSNLVFVELENPFLNGDRTYMGCVYCDECLN